MTVTDKDDYRIVEDDKNEGKGFPVRLQTAEFEHIKDKHLVVDLLNKPVLNDEELNAYLALSKKLRKEKKSFVLVLEVQDVDELPEELAVVPSLQEAEDVIRMEDIERDMGFFE